MFYNAEFVDKINNIQEEFNKLLEERNANSPTKVRASPTKEKGSVGLNVSAKFAAKGGDDLKGDGFYKVMDMIYGGKNPKRHESPTKRLMEQKNAAWKHKEFLSKNLSKGDNYSLTYVCDPKKTYVIQPKEGEIKYGMAEKNPLKFYDTVMKQKVTEHKVQRAKTFEGHADGELPKKKVLKKGRSLELRSRVTIRAIARILLAVQRKLEDLLVEHTDENVSPEDIQRAMSHPATQEVVQRHVAKENIKLVH